MITMSEKKESNEKVVATKKYTFEALRSITLNRGKQGNSEQKRESKYKDILDKNNINYSKW